MARTSMDGPPLNATPADDARWRGERNNGGPIRSVYPRMTQRDAEDDARRQQMERYQEREAYQNLQGQLGQRMVAQSSDAYLFRAALNEVYTTTAFQPAVEVAPEEPPAPVSRHREVDLEPAREIRTPAVVARDIEL